jgi:hypothetical protein
MDAASYAVERNRNLQDNVQKIIQMMLMGKQNKQEQDWRQGQFDYQKGQDVINQGQQDRALERQDKQFDQTQKYQNKRMDLDSALLEIRQNPQSSQALNYNFLRQNGLSHEDAILAAFKPTQQRESIPDAANRAGAIAQARGTGKYNPNTTSKPDWSTQQDVSLTKWAENEKLGINTAYDKLEADAAILANTPYGQKTISNLKEQRAEQLRKVEESYQAQLKKIKSSGGKTESSVLPPPPPGAKIK